MDIGASLVADSQTSELVEPSHRAFDDPAVTTEPLPAFDSSAGDARSDTAPSEQYSAKAVVVAFVGMKLGRPLARPAQRASDGPNGIDDRFQHLAVVDVGGRLSHRERDSVAVDHNMALRARFAAIRWIRPGLWAPPGAGTLAESTHARSQSMSSAWPSRSSNVWWSRSHTPASCQSLSRRQQVMPLPQPISCGNISHGAPDRRMNKMPVSALRLSTLGRPPFGFAGSAGSKGSTAAHSSSLTSGFAMPPFYLLSGFC